MDIRRFKEFGRKGHYLIQYEPRILDAYDEFSSEFSEVRGRPWPLTDWLVTREVTRRMDGNDFLKRRKEWVAKITNIGGIELYLERRV